HGGSHEAGEEVVQRILQPHVPFQKLCDSDRKKEIEDTHHGVMYKRTVEDTERICIKTLSPEDKEETISVDWKVFRSKRGFDNLFWDYWNDHGEQWTEWIKGETPRAPWMKRDAVTFAKLAHNKEKYPGGFKQLWKERGQSVLASWKRDGVPATKVLALAKFRKERDNRAANLKKKLKPKRRRGTVKSRTERTKRKRARAEA